MQDAVRLTRSIRRMVTIVKPEPNEWDKLGPTKPAKPKSQWDDALAMLESSEVGVKVYFANEKERKGSRIALGRLTKERGIDTDARFGEDEKGPFFILKKADATTSTGKPRKKPSPKTKGDKNS